MALLERKKKKDKSFIINTTKLSILISWWQCCAITTCKKQSTFCLKVKFVSVLVKCNENKCKTDLLMQPGTNPDMITSTHLAL